MCAKFLHYFAVTGQFTVQYNSHFSARQLYLHLHCTSLCGLHFTLQCNTYHSAVKLVSWLYLHLWCTGHYATVHNEVQYSFKLYLHLYCTELWSTSHSAITPSRKIFKNLCKFLTNGRETGKVALISCIWHLKFQIWCKGRGRRIGSGSAYLTKVHQD